MHQRRAAGLELLAHFPVDRDVGASEAVDRLLGIADEEEAAGRRPCLAPVGLGRIVGGEQQQDLGLQRIGVLELIDEHPLEAALKAGADLRVVADQVARAEQQVEEVERAGVRLQLLVALERGPQFGLEPRGEIRVGVHPELIETRAQLADGRPHAVARHAVAVGAAPSLTRVGQHAIARQIDEASFPAVVVDVRVAERLLQADLVAQPAYRVGPGEERIVSRGGIAREVGALVQQRDHREDRVLAIEGIPRPWRGEIAPFREIPRRPAQPVDRPIVVPAERRSAERPANALRRTRQLLLQPAAERLVEQTLRSGFGQHLEQRVDAGLDRPLAQEIGAEGVDRADVCFFELRAARGRRARARCRVARWLSPAAAFDVEPFAQAQLQLAGGLLRERDGNDLADVGPALRQRCERFGSRARSSCPCRQPLRRSASSRARWR